MKTLKGIPASSGKVKGMILVTKCTSPTWTPLIAIANGVTTDLGGSLSHAAIVSREFGIPAVVGPKKPPKYCKMTRR